MYGPNTNLGHSSIVYMLESQAEYVNDALNTMKRERLDALDVNESVQVHYNKGIQHELQHTVWNKGGCSSWYIDPVAYMWCAHTAIDRAAIPSVA